MVRHEGIVYFVLPRWIDMSQKTIIRDVLMTYLMAIMLVREQSRWKIDGAQWIGVGGHMTVSCETKRD